MVETRAVVKKLTHPDPAQGMSIERLDAVQELQPPPSLLPSGLCRSQVTRRIPHHQRPVLPDPSATPRGGET